MRWAIALSATLLAACASPQPPAQNATSGAPITTLGAGAPLAPPDRPPPKRACSGGIVIGMSAEQVLASCWGRPQRKNTTLTGNATHEQWVYGFNYVYLRDGVVTSIQTSR